MEPDPRREKLRVRLSQRDSCPHQRQVRGGAGPSTAVACRAGPLQPQLVSHPRGAHPAPRQELQQQGSGTLLLAPLLEGPEANSSQASVL